MSLKPEQPLPAPETIQPDIDSRGRKALGEKNWDSILLAYEGDESMSEETISALLAWTVAEMETVPTSPARLEIEDNIKNGGELANVIKLRYETRTTAADRGTTAVQGNE